MSDLPNDDFKDEEPTPTAENRDERMQALIQKNRKASANYLRKMANMIEQDKIDAFDLAWSPQYERPNGQILFDTKGITFADDPPPKPNKIEVQDLTEALRS